MTRLHVITGEHGTGKTTAAFEMQKTERAADWMVVDDSKGTPYDRLEDVRQGLAGERNVILVLNSPEHVEVTSQHQVQLPRAFGSVVLASTVDNTKRRIFSLQSNTNWWSDSSGSTYSAAALIAASRVYTGPGE